MDALPLSYHGVAFRSRLEADWAATLTDRGISWDYEPEGYRLSDGTWYSPDFWLPSARAWLEVKGDHDARLTKVHQFAADLWRESGCNDTYDPAAPMVLLGRAPTRNDDLYIRGQWEPNLIGVMGPGKMYSVGMTRCPHCDAGTIVAFWQPTCRNCDMTYSDPRDAWWDPWSNNLLNESFVRAPRPVGGS